LLSLEDTLKRERAGSRVKRGGRTGLVRNPMSRRNRTGRGHPWWRDLGDAGLIRAEPATPDELLHTLKDFARREVGLLVVDGGDGTVREVLSALPQAYGEAPPALAVLASGTTNLIAADVGAGRADAATIALLGEIARSGPRAANVQRRSTVQISWPDGSRPPIAGMFVGAAAFTRATDLSVGLVRQGRVEEGAGVAVTLLSSMAQTLAGAERERWLQGDPMAVAVDGGPVAEHPRFLVLATTLHRLMLGIWPFWGEGEGALRYLDVAGSPRRLAAALPAVLRGRPRKWMAEEGYRSGRAETLDLTLAEPFVVDGEQFTPGPGGRVRLQAGQSIDFIVP
jgi:diacylglycerol kinase family enzyme